MGQYPFVNSEKLQAIIANIYIRITNDLYRCIFMKIYSIFRVIDDVFMRFYVVAIVENALGRQFLL